MNVIDLIQKEQEKASVPDFRPGDTVKVYSKVVEGGKERIQMFEGTVTVRKGGGSAESVTVRTSTWASALSAMTLGAWPP